MDPATVGAIVTGNRGQTWRFPLFEIIFRTGETFPIKTRKKPICQG